jgi:hypothetical protein
MDASSVLVSLSGIEDITQDMGAILGTTADISDLKNLTLDIEDAFYQLQLQIEDLLSESVTIVRDALVLKLETDGVMEIEQASEKVYEDLLEIRRRLEEAGIVARPIIESIAIFEEAYKSDLDYLVEKFIQVEAVLRLHIQILDTYANKPVIETWYEFR